MHELDALCAVLGQGVALARRLDPADFVRPIPPGKSGVGSHLRHAAGFVRAFLDGLADGRIDYDARGRDERFERDPAVAARQLGALIEELRARAPLDLGRAVDVRLEAPADAGPHEHWHGSTLGRELASLVSHTVHHHALVALALRTAGADVPLEFGVAPSTLAHWKAEAARREPAALRSA